MGGSAAVDPGRRVRNKQEKLDRIFRSAADLFAVKGFGAVSTQEVSERADVAAGTLFRYAASKGELLLMVYNEELRQALADGRQRADDRDDAVDAVVEMVLPILERADGSPENSAMYQREMLFGSPDEQYRREGLTQIAQLERGIADRLVDEAQRRGLRADSDAALLAAVTVFAAIHLTVARFSTGAHSHRDLVSDLRTQIAQVAAGYWAALESAA